MNCDIAWAAGLFEGEGCITYGSSKNYPRLQLKTTDQDVIERFTIAVGVGKISELNYKTSTGKTIWMWNCGKSNEVRDLLEKFLPWLGQRRTEKAEEALEKVAGIKEYVV
jgi:hypothetical protein